ncbi:MAG: GDP-L-fucose synthase [Defluviitaleaceae bacterium]|nr:GDP-L-fucose synthase [Defluviitaleaceae bacterium]
MTKQDKIFIAGHRGMVGAALVRAMHEQEYENIITRTSGMLDLRRQSDVEYFFEQEKPDIVVLAAAKVGGIYANNTYPAEFGYDNLIMALNVIHAAWKNRVKKLLFLGSSCIYPRTASQPMKESCLLTGELEQTNEAYALAKIAGLKLCSYYNRQYDADFISCMPTNLYGPGDNYHIKNSHVLPALIRRFHEAKEAGSPEVTIWGTGTPLREFLYVDDLANACIFLLENYTGDETVNIGTGKEITISELAKLVADIIGYSGKIIQDSSMPDGTPRKLLDVSKMKALGWKYTTELKDGIRLTYKDFLACGGRE